MKDGARRIPIGSALLVASAGIVLLDRSFETPLITPVVLALLGLAALAEYLRMAGARTGPALARTTLAGGAVLLVVAVVPAARGVLGFVPAIALTSWLVFFALGLACLASRWRSAVAKDDIAAAGIAWVGFAICALPAALLIGTTQLEPDGLLFTLLVIIGSKLNDIGGYLIGSTAKGPKLCPGISPNKTWSGAIGGLLLGTAGALALGLLLPGVRDRLDVPELLVLGIALGVSTQSGDLFESAFKRSVDAKDSGALIPAFGGILDLVDSLIFAGPVGYIMGLSWLAN